MCSPGLKSRDEATRHALIVHCDVSWNLGDSSAFYLFREIFRRAAYSVVLQSENNLAGSPLRDARFP
jgi:hypothetical protein